MIEPFYSDRHWIEDGVQDATPAWRRSPPGFNRCDYGCIEDFEVLVIRTLREG
jgi:hypothetical protein